MNVEIMIDFSSMVMNFLITLQLIQKLLLEFQKLLLEYHMMTTQMPM